MTERKIFPPHHLRVICGVGESARRPASVAVAQNTKQTNNSDHTMKLKHTLLVLAALAVPQFTFAAEEGDKPVKFEDLPPAVAKAMKAAAGDAKLKNIHLSDEDGTPAYEAEWTAGGHKHEIAVTKDGKVLVTEEIITLKEAPEAVQAAILKEAGSNKITEVEKVFEKGKTAYEATFKQGKGKLVVKLSEAGKVLERENPDAEKAEKAAKKKN